MSKKNSITPLTAHPIEFMTLGSAILERCTRSSSSSKTAFIYKEPSRWREVSWNEVLNRMKSIAGGFQKLGVQKGAPVALLSQTRFEWMLIDYTLQTLGAVTVPIYQSNLPEEVAYILNNCGAEGICVEDRGQLEKVKQVLGQCPRLKWVVVLDGSTEHQTIGNVSFFGLQSIEKEPPMTFEELKQHADAVQTEDLATVIYTSGTTGLPKGASLPQRALCAASLSIRTHQIDENDRFLTFLPFAHVLGRTELFMPVFWGTQIWFAQSLNSMLEDLQVAKPTVLLSVPRIYEKVYAKVTHLVESGSWIKKALFKKAMVVGTQVSEAIEAGKKVSISTSLQFQIFQKLIFSQVYEKFGGRLRFAVSGGAPLSADIARFFDMCGVRVLEGYGLTETSGPVTVNFPNDYRFGTVGKPLGDVQIKIAEDGEILIKGSPVFTGYFNNPEETEKSFDTIKGVRWFRSGDIGVVKEGFLRITDRKKDLIITSAGKNVAPQMIENLLKQEQLVSQVLAVGDKQKYIATLVTLDRGQLHDFFKQKGLAFESADQAALHKEVHQVIEANIKRVNAKLPNYATIKRFKILASDFTIEAGELTPSLKIKRKYCVDKYRSEVESLFT